MIPPHLPAASGRVAGLLPLPLAMLATGAAAAGTAPVQAELDLGAVTELFGRWGSSPGWTRAKG